MRDLDEIHYSSDRGDQTAEALEQWAAGQQPELRLRVLSAPESARIHAAGDIVEPQVLGDGSAVQCAWLAVAEAAHDLAKVATRLRLRSEPARHLRQFLVDHYVHLHDLSIYDPTGEARRDASRIEVQAARRPDLFARWCEGLDRLCDPELWARLTGCHLLIEELSELESEVEHGAGPVAKNMSPASEPQAAGSVGQGIESTTVSAGAGMQCGFFAAIKAAFEDLRILGGIIDVGASHYALKADLDRAMPSNLRAIEEEWAQTMSDDALRAFQGTEAVRDPIRVQVVIQWFSENTQGLRTRLANVAAMIESRSAALIRAAVEPWSVQGHDLKANSACGLLRLLSLEALEYLDDREQGDYLSMAYHQQRMLGLTALGQLELAAEREAALAERDVASGMPIPDTYQQAGRDAAHPETPALQVPAVALDMAAENILAHLLKKGNTSTTTEGLLAVSGVSARKTEEILRQMHSRCGRCSTEKEPCLDHVGLLERETGKSRGWHRASDFGIQVARWQAEPVPESRRS